MAASGDTSIFKATLIPVFICGCGLNLDSEIGSLFVNLNTGITWLSPRQRRDECSRAFQGPDQEGDKYAVAVSDG